VFCKMISIGTINYPQEEIEYFNKEMKLRINNAEFERGELIITKTYCKQNLHI